MWIRILGCALLSLCLAVPAWADKAEYLESTLQNAVGATGNGAMIPVDRFSAVALDVTITGVATVTFEGSAAGGVATAIVCVAASDATRARVTSTAVTGLFQCNTAGLVGVRARVSAFTNGTITVFARATTALFIP
jgi:hypothetical protein